MVLTAKEVNAKEVKEAKNTNWTSLRAWRGVGCMPLYFTERRVKETQLCVLRLPRTRSAPEEVIHTSYRAVKAELLTRYRISRKDPPPGKDEDEKEPTERLIKEEEEEKRRGKERSLRIQKKKKKNKKTQKKTIYDETDEEEEEKNKKKAIMKTLRRRQRKKTKRRTPRQEIHVKCRGKRSFYMILRECLVRGKKMTLADISLALHLQEWEITEPEESLADPSVMNVRCPGMKDFEVQEKKKEKIVEM